MENLLEKIQKVVEGTVMCSFSTITTDGKPWVRYVMAQFSEDLTIQFSTHVTDRKVEQIKSHNEVHLTCGVTDPSILKPYLQIQGKATLINDSKAKHALWGPGMEKIYKGPDDENYGVIRVVPYRIEYCEVGEHEIKVLNIN